MTHIVSIIGARPQFIKAAVLSRLIRSKQWASKVKETLIHTGQHYDSNMSDVFFDEMKIPKPDIHLSIGGGSHGQMTGQMLIEIEQQLMKLKPDVVVVYGDTNSTLAGALAASKLQIPVAHVEAGLRSFWKVMPEEQNRILTDHLSTWLLCPTVTAIDNLNKEGITKGVYNVGDIMLDAHLYYRQLIEEEMNNGISRLKKIPELSNGQLTSDFALATIHRAENTDDPARLTAIVQALNKLPVKVVLPLHPRTSKVIDNMGLKFASNILVTKPVGYFEILTLQMKCNCIITDSGGLQKEAYFVKKPCVTLRDQTEWVETVESGWNVLAGADKETIIQSVTNLSHPDNYQEYYGDGRTGQVILETLLENI